MQGWIVRGYEKKGQKEEGFEAQPHLIGGRTAVITGCCPAQERLTQ